MIIRLKGALGNQMFQYAFGRAVSLEKDCKLILDLSEYEQPHPKHTPRTYTLDKFAIEAETVGGRGQAASQSNTPGMLFLRKIKRFFRSEKLYRYDERFLSRVSCDSHLEGYWQTELYFASISNILRKEFTLKQPLSLPAQKIEDLIKAAEFPVSLHVRRGDYVSNPRYQMHHGFIGEDYYRKAFSFLKEKTEEHFNIFIFSDDIEWAEKNIPSIAPLGSSLTYVSPSEVSDYESLVLMSTCKHHIIANSSFSWWGAWLNPHKEKIVIAPQQWLTDETIDTKDATPPDWIRL